MINIIPEEHAAPPNSWPKDWTEWHTNLRTLLNLIHNAVLEDQEASRLTRKSGNAKDVELDSSRM